MGYLDHTVRFLVCHIRATVHLFSIRVRASKYLHTLNRIWNAIAIIGIAIFYFPQSQVRGQRQTVRVILPKIDFVGALLSVGGLTLLYVPCSIKKLKFQTDNVTAW